MLSDPAALIAADEIHFQHHNSNPFCLRWIATDLKHTLFSEQADSLAYHILDQISHPLSHFGVLSTKQAQNSNFPIQPQSYAFVWLHHFTHSELLAEIV